MKNKILVLTVLFIAVLAINNNQALAQDLTPKKNETTGKWGYVNKQGKIVIPYKYEIAAEFSEGLAAVAINTKGGYIDQTGKTVIPFKYEGMLQFHNGFAIVIIY